MSQSLTSKTLIPLGSIIILAVGVFYLSISYATILENKAHVQKNEIAIKAHSGETNKNYIEIIQRLTRIEEALKK